MEIHRLCAMIRQRVSVELLESLDAEERSQILIAALYELSRSVLPLLGPPRRSLEYLDRQGTVLDLISFIAIPLVRGQERRGVAVLSELAEGCLDPLLKKKLTVYAHELLAKSNRPQAAAAAAVARRRRSWLLPAFSAAALLFYLGWAAHPGKEPREGKNGAASVPRAGADATGIKHGSEPVPAADRLAGEGAASRQRSGESVGPAERRAAASGAAQPGDQVTAVRIVNNQVLVPVLLKNAGETVQVELVLDTGANRTVIHDTFAGRLQIDLRLAKGAMSEVADGRVIHSRVARIDSLSVGPFALAPVELELIAYTGREGVRDGLLGMDFLGRHRYQIDMEHELIRWF